jgi:hypothetical protein
MPWKRLWEWRYSSTHPLTSALVRGEWSASRPGRCTPRETTPGTHWIGGWVGPRASLGAVWKRKIHRLRRYSNPDYPIVQPLRRGISWLAEWLLASQDGFCSMELWLLLLLSSLITVSFSLVLLPLNQWCTQPLRLQTSDLCAMSLVRLLFVENLLYVFLVLFPDIFLVLSYSSCGPNDHWYDEAFPVPHSLNFYT